MRLSNRSKVSYYNFILTLINVLILVGIATFILEETKLAMFGKESYLFIIVPVLLLVLFLIRGRQIFEYDSDGEAVNFRNRHIIPFLGKDAKDEFPKYKLVSYEFVNAFFFRKLYIKIKSKKEHLTILKYDISYLTEKESKDLKMSLRKIIHQNKEAKREGKTVV